MAKSSAASKWTPIRAGLSKMTLRERWVRTMHYKKADRLPMMEFGYWDETLPLWHEQGLPRTVRTEAQAYAYFGIEDWRDEGVNTDGLCPGFESETIEETEDYIIWRDEERRGQEGIEEGHQDDPAFHRVRAEEPRGLEALQGAARPGDAGAVPRRLGGAREGVPHARLPALASASAA